jgi:competence protein ComFC
MKGKFIPMLIRRVVELFTPSQCLGCAQDGDILCAGCIDKAAAGRTWVTYPEATPLSGCAVGAYYEGPVKELILQLKFHRARSAVEDAASLVAAALPEDLRVDVVTSVPISPARYRERGYNQSGLIARQVARQLRLPYASLLSRVTSAHQMGLDRSRRLVQIKGAFYPLRELDGRRVLVVDDVITTGATLLECAETLRAVGASQVWAGVVARH